MTYEPFRRLSRRDICGGGLAAFAGLVSLPGHGFADKTERSLRDRARDKGILFGASLAVHEFDRDYGPAYQRMYEHDAGIVTSELEFKMATMRDVEGQFDFSSADRLVAFANERSMAVRAHTLVWNDYLPDWIRALEAGAAGALMLSHIETVTRRYGKRVKYWDVVNEPIAPWDRLAGNLRKGPFLAAFGEDYIVKAFGAARAIVPDATLVLNEAQTETDDELGATFRSSLLALLKRLKDKGASIDAIGLQSHLRCAARYDLPKFIAFLNEVAALGYDIHVTELDVNDTGISGSLEKRDAAVANLYERYLTEVLKIESVRVVQTWQMADHTSWMQDPDAQSRMHIRKLPRPLLYDGAFKKKPAWHAIARAFDAAPKR